MTFFQAWSFTQAWQIVDLVSTRLVDLATCVNASRKSGDIQSLSLRHWRAFGWKTNRTKLHACQDIHGRLCPHLPAFWSSGMLCSRCMLSTGHRQFPCRGHWTLGEQGQAIVHHVLGANQETCKVMACSLTTCHSAWENGNLRKWWHPKISYCMLHCEQERASSVGYMILANCEFVRIPWAFSVHVWYAFFRRTHSLFLKALFLQPSQPHLSLSHTNPMLERHWWWDDQTARWEATRSSIVWHHVNTSEGAGSRRRLVSNMNGWFKIHATWPARPAW